MILDGLQYLLWQRGDMGGTIYTECQKKLHTFVFSISSVNVNVFWLKFLISIIK